MTTYSIALFHHGIKGQRWGERRFQNSDGSLTKAGIERYRKDVDEIASKESLPNRLGLGVKKNRTYNQGLAKSGKELTARFLKDYGNDTVGFTDILTKRNKSGDISYVGQKIGVDAPTRKQRRKASKDLITTGHKFMSDTPEIARYLAVLSIHNEFISPAEQLRIAAGLPRYKTNRGAT